MSRARKEVEHLFNGGMAVTPLPLASVPASIDGQLAVVTDQPGKRLYVRESGGLVPAIDVGSAGETSGYIYMTVDPVSGVSPSDGTVIHNQAEYDALGAPLLYLNDAVRILPDGLGAPVVIQLEDGEHRDDPTRVPVSGVYPITMRVPNRIVSLRDDYWIGEDFTNLRYWQGIHVEGKNKTTIEASQAGTLGSLWVLTRSAGTWTPGEHVGRLVQFDTGPNAGFVTPIVDNDATTITLSCSWLGSGACTFTIYEPSAAIVNENAFTRFLLSTQIDSPFVTFYNVKLGTPAKPCDGVVTSSLIGAQIYGCIFYSGDVGNPFFLSRNSFLRIDWSVLRGDIATAPIITVERNAFLFWFSSFVKSISGPVIRAGSAGGCIGWDDGVAQLTVGTGDTAIIEVRAGSVWEHAQGVRLIGNTTCVGVKLVGGEVYCRRNPDLSYQRFNASFKDVATAILAQGASLSGVYAQAPGTSSGVGIGWRVEKGADLAISGLANLPATTEVQIDGTNLTYSGDFAADGDEVTGSGGSHLLRRAT